MTPKKVKQLLKLLDEFQHVMEKVDEKLEGLTSRERSVIQLVHHWVTWYGRDELDMDL